MVIRVLIYANKGAKDSDKPLFGRLIDWSDDILFPYSHFDSVMRICFGRNCLVCFEQSVL